MPYAIIVGVPDAREDCFLAIPYHPASKDIFDHVTQAASDLSLRRVCVRSNIMQAGVEFMSDVGDATRAARVVIAVCSPDPSENGATNPNVMYELGYAHALGKPTIILTSDANSLPADLKGMYVTEYSAAELGSSELTARIREAIRAARGRMEDGNPLTDKSYHHVSVTSGRYLTFQNPVFWDCFRQVLSFARLVHEHHQIDATFVEEFWERAAAMFLNTGQTQYVIELASAWRKYERFYENVTEPTVHQQLHVRTGEVAKAFNGIAREAGEDLAAQLEDCTRFYLELQDQLERYPQIVLETGNCVDEGLAGNPQDLPAVQRLYSHAQKLSKASSAIVRYSDRMMVNLIGMTDRPGG